MIIYYTDRFTGSREESRRLLKEAIAVHTGDEEQAKTLIGALKKGEHGKPYIEGFCCFSISHTGSIWAALFADRECGLDIQLARKCDAKAIAERFFPPEDAAFIASAFDEETPDGSGERAAETFFRIWARREALVKAVGSSVYDPDLPAVLSGKAEVNGKRYSIEDIDFLRRSQLHAAICVEGGASYHVPEVRRLEASGCFPE